MIEDLKVTERLPLQPWMTAPATKAVLDALRADGAEVRFVGGCVRDALKALPIKDIDLATPDRPETVMSLLKSAGLKAVPTGLAHGTVTAVSDGQPYEVTTLREDVETDGRHAVVAYTDDWVQDAARRDLTINALSCRPDGTLFDPFGGLDDLRAGRVRFVGEAGERITEDYLRMLRFFRFHAFYGDGDLDPDGLAAAKELAPNLASLSGERVREELLRLLAADKPLPVLATMERVSVLKILLPQLRSDHSILASLMETEIETDPLLRLAALLDGSGEEAEQVSERLRLSRAQSDRLFALRTAGQKMTSWSPKIGQATREIRQSLYDLGPELTRDLLRLDWARRPTEERRADCRDLSASLAVTEDWDGPVFPLRGRDALTLGAEAGPALGDALDRVESWWREADFAPDRDACLAQLKQELRGS